METGRSRLRETSRRLRLVSLSAVGLIVAMLVGTAPALAQQQEGPYYAEETTITGVVSTKELPNITQPIYVIADEENGVERPIQTLGPDEGGPVLSQYVGQRVTVTGIPQTLGNPPSNFDNFLTDVPVLVTSIETLESGSGGNNVACAELGDTGEQTQQQAQAILNQDPSDPNGLDADGDGIPCEFTESSSQITYEDGSTIFITTVSQQPQLPQQQPTTQQMQNLPDTGGPALLPIVSIAAVMMGIGGLLLRRRPS